MISFSEHNFEWIQRFLRTELHYSGQVVDVGEWQSIRRSERDLPQQKTIELQNVVFEYPIPATMEELQEDVHPNLPFAEAQFQDRVYGDPVNPPPSDELWPWAHHLDDDKASGQYSHTYPERYWPKYANYEGVEHEEPSDSEIRRGIRYPYGDLGDVVSQLSRSPGTRQAYLPVWFPEDTGAVHGERVPCSLGYHFLLRGGKLNITYFIRSVDFFRHFPDDVYMTCRLAQWMCGQLWNIAENPYQSDNLQVGTLVMHIGSLHVFEAEGKRLERS